MVRAALKKVKEDDGPKLEDELSLFNVLLAGRIKEDPHWRLTNEDFSELEQDFLQLNAMAYFQDEALDRLIKLSDLFMSPKDLEFFMRYTYEDTDDPRIREMR